MAYDPADLRLPSWLIRALDLWIGIRLPLPGGWSLGVSRPGSVMFFSTLGVWAAAFYSANNLLYLCGSMLLMIMLGAMFQGVWILRRLPDLRTGFPRWLEAGSPRVLCEPTPGIAGLLAQVDVQVEGFPCSLQWWNGGERAHLDGRIHVSRRGVLHIRRLYCSTTAPIGMWRLGRLCTVDLRIPVLPPPVAMAQGQGLWDGGVQSARHRDGDDFHELRGYVAGDAPARIHWRKAGEDMRDWRVKSFSHTLGAPSQEGLRVDLRLPAHAGLEDFECLLGMAWHWLREHWRAGRPVGDVVLGRRRYALEDEEQRQALLLALAEARPETEPPLDGSGMLLSLVEA